MRVVQTIVPTVARITVRSHAKAVKTVIVAWVAVAAHSANVSMQMNLPSSQL
jgi:hypothetical protein